MYKTVLHLILVMLIIIPVTASSADSIPNAALRVAVQQREDGKMGKGFHILELFCWEGNCSLSSVSINQCGEAGSGKQAFYPKAQHSSTSMGNLKVRNEGTSIVIQETGSDTFGEYVNNLRFDYEPEEKDKIITRLIGFSGGYVKNSVIL